MNSSFRKKTLAVIVICLMALMSLPMVMGSNEYFVENLDGNILYVGGNGPGNYTTIQDAVDAASDGDTIFVFNGIYYENLNVNKILNLIGEDRDSTIIDGENKDNVIKIFEDNVKIEKFSIRNCKNDYGFSGVNFDSNNNFLLDCNIYDNYWGVLCYGDDNHISNNNVFSNGCGIVLSGANQNMIDNNRISENHGGI